MRLTLTLILAATVGLIGVLVFAPEQGEEELDLDARRSEEERGSDAAQVIGHRIHTEGVFTPREAKSLVDGQRVTYPELLIWSGASEPDGDRAHRFEDLLILWNPPPRSPADLDLLTDVRVTASRDRIRPLLAAAIGTRSSGLVAERARVIGDRALREVQRMELTESVRLHLLDPAEPEESAIRFVGSQLELLSSGTGIDRLESHEPLQLRGPPGSVRALGMQIAIPAGRLELEGPLGGELAAAAWLSSLLPGLRPDLPVAFSAADGLVYEPEDPRQDRRTRRPEGRIVLRGKVRLEQADLVFAGEDLAIEVGGEESRVRRVDSDEPVAIRGTNLEVTGPGIHWTAAAFGRPGDLKTGPGAVRIERRPSREDGLEASPDETLIVTASDGLTWRGLGGPAHQPWTIELREDARFQGLGYEGNGDRLRLRLERSATDRGSSDRVPRWLELEGNAWATFSEGGISANQIHLERERDAENGLGRDFATAEGSPRMVWTGLDIPPGRAAEWVGEKGWLELRSNGPLTLTRDRARPSQVQISAGGRVRIERRVEGPDALPRATLTSREIELDLERSAFLDTPEPPDSNWRVTTIRLQGDVAGTLHDRAELRGESLTLDLDQSRIDLSAPSGAWLRQHEGGRAVIANIIRFDARLGHLALSGNVEVEGELPPIALGRLFGNSGSAGGAAAEEVASTLRSDTASLWIARGSQAGDPARVAELSAHSEEFLELEQAGRTTLTGTSLRADFATRWLAAQGAPLDLIHRRPDGKEDRFRAPRVEVLNERVWAEGPVRATVHLARGALPFDLPGWQRGPVEPGRVVPSELRAEESLFASPRHALGEGGVHLELRDPETGERIVAKGDRMLLGFTSQAASAAARPPADALRVDRASLLGDAEFLTPDLSGHGEVLLVSSTLRRMFLYTPGGKATLTTEETGELHKVHFEVDFTDPEAPRIIASDVIGLR